MVAHLLEPEQPGEHRAPPVDALGLVGPGEQVVDDRLVERGLLAGERAAVDRLDLVGQVGDDRPVGLQPAQDERAGDPPEQRGRLGVAVRARWAGRTARGTTRADPSSPGLRNCMIDHSSLSRFSTGVPVSATRRPAPSCADGLGLRGAGVLDLLGLVEHEPAPGDRGELVEVAGEPASTSSGRRRGRRPARRTAASSSCRAGPWWTSTPSAGAKRASSRSQLPSTDTGHTTSVGPSARVGEQRGDELRGLAEAHVVGQAGAEAEPAEERQPARAPLLVGPQLAVEPGRRRQRFDGGVERVVEERRSQATADASTPTTSTSSATAELVETQPGAQQVGRGGGAGRADGVQQRADPAGSISTHWPRSRTSELLRVGGTGQGGEVGVWSAAARRARPPS